MAFNEFSMKVGNSTESGFSLGRVPVREEELNILVGLGGSGVDMLREAKGLISRMCCDDNNRRKAPKRVVYLGIDSDNAYLDQSWQCFDGRTVKLRRENPGSEQFPIANFDIARFLAPENRAVNTAQYPYIFEWLDPELWNYFCGDSFGAGGIPQLGRLYLFKNIDMIAERLRALISAAQNDETIRQCNVFLFSGVSGGTGGGAYLDMAYALRQIVKMLPQLIG